MERRRRWMPLERCCGRAQEWIVLSVLLEPLFEAV